MIEKFLLEHPFLACYIVIITAVISILTAVTFYITRKIFSMGTETELPTVKIKADSFRNKLLLTCMGGIFEEE